MALHQLLVFDDKILYLLLEALVLLAQLGVLVSLAGYLLVTALHFVLALLQLTGQLHLVALLRKISMAAF